jgi:hypothetical protein
MLGIMALACPFKGHVSHFQVGTKFSIVCQHALHFHLLEFMHNTYFSAGTKSKYSRSFLFISFLSKVRGCFLVPSSWSPTSTNQIYYNKTRGAIENLECNICKNRIQERISPYLVMATGNACLDH